MSIKSFLDLEVYRLLFAKDCNYIAIKIYNQLFAEAEVLGSKLRRLHDNRTDFRS